MVKKYTCIVCPNGCELQAELEDGKMLELRGAGCKRGIDYVEQELANPQRNIASSILLEGGVLPLVSVRLSRPIPKAKIFEVMAAIKKARLQAPVHAGQVAIANVLGLGSDVIVTKHVA
ncbi:MAG TPA: molybdopterin oxidoreductase, partial [Firmicutes bacterium]|nr:molybdopterin oxidoreductase [Bacillota bacterium]